MNKTSNNEKLNVKEKKEEMYKDDIRKISFTKDQVRETVKFLEASLERGNIIRVIQDQEREEIKKLMKFLDDTGGDALKE